MEVMICRLQDGKMQDWRKMRDELARAALLTIDQGAQSESARMKATSWLLRRFHPTLLPTLSRNSRLPAVELEARYAQAYYQLARYESQEDNKNPLPTRALVVRELPNFRRALDLTLAAGDMDTAVEFADSIAKFLNFFGRWSERDAMMEVVSRQFQSSVVSHQRSAVSRQPSSASFVHGHAR